MLADTLTLGTGGNELTYGKHYGDAQSGAYYSVASLSTDNTQSLAVQSQLDKSKARRTLIDFRQNVPIPGSTSAAYGVLRAYINFVVPSHVDRADVLEHCARMGSLLGNTTVMNNILDGMK